jgi:hypothetical protein
MDEVLASPTLEPSAVAPSSPPATTVNDPPEPHARRSERQRELLNSALANADPKAAVVGSAVAELLELSQAIAAATMDVAAAVGNPADKLDKLVRGAQMCTNICRLATKLP